MAAKNKHHKKSKLSRKVTSKYKENDMEAEEDGDTGDVEDENSAKKDEEDLSLDEVLHLGGTRVRSDRHVHTFFTLIFLFCS